MHLPGVVHCGCDQRCRAPHVADIDSRGNFDRVNVRLLVRRCSSRLENHCQRESRWMSDSNWAQDSDQTS